MTRTHHVVGLDLSLVSTGIASTEGWVERIQSKPTKAPTLATRSARLRQIADEALDAIGLPALVVVEGPAYGLTTGSSHDRAGLWWLIVEALHDTGTPVVEIPPAVRMKYATGKGNAAKDLVLAATIKRYSEFDVTGNDVADSLILAAMGARWLGHPLETSLPVANLAAMQGVKWPST